MARFMLCPLGSGVAPVGTEPRQQRSVAASCCCCVLALLLLSCVARCVRRRRRPCRGRNGSASQVPPATVQAASASSPGGAFGPATVQPGEVLAINRQMSQLRARQWQLRDWEAEQLGARTARARAEVQESGQATLPQMVLTAMRGESRLWDASADLVAACPGNQREALLHSLISVASHSPEACGCLVARLVEEEACNARAPSMMVSELIESLVCVALGLLGSARSEFWDTDIEAMIRTMTHMSHEDEQDDGSIEIRKFVSLLISTVSTKIASLPGCVRLVCHQVYTEAERRFGHFRAQNAVVTLLVKCILTPSFLRVARRLQCETGAHDTTFSKRSLMVARILGEISALAHHEPGRGPPVEDAHVQQVDDLRAVVDQIYWLPIPHDMGLAVGDQEAQVAATKLVHMCRTWASSQRADGLALLAEPFAQLFGPDESRSHEV